MKKHRPTKWSGAVAVCLAAAFLGGGLMFSRSGSAPLSSGKEMEKEQNADLHWQGRSYRYNSHLSNYLFLGIDKEAQEQTNPGRANAGQADAIYLLSYDRVEESCTIISVPRDTLTEISVYGPGGTSLGQTTDHISLSYAYGDGAHESCRLAKEAVSGLFKNLPVLGYCAIDPGGIPALTASVGGVTVTVPNDSLASVDPALTAGKQVTLDAEITEQFVRYRNTQAAHSALARMERQQAFLQAFGETAGERLREEPSFAGALYQALEPHMVTNLSGADWARLLLHLADSRIREHWTVPGRPVTEGEYDAYQVEEEALLEKIVTTFYEELGNTEQ